MNFECGVWEQPSCVQCPALPRLLGGQGEVELMVDDTLGLAGHDGTVEVAQLLDGPQLTWAEDKKEDISLPALQRGWPGSEAPVVFAPSTPP